MTREQTFTLTRTGHLQRSVTPRRGKPYTHTCRSESFFSVMHAIDEATEGATIDEIARAEDVPMTQVATLLAFLFERGIVEREGRRNFATAAGDTYLEGMTEILAMEHALKTGAHATPSAP